LIFISVFRPTNLSQPYHNIYDLLVSFFEISAKRGSILYYLHSESNETVRDS
jgi:hypothetical protein